MADRLLERAGVDQRRHAGITQERHFAVAALACDRLGEDWSQRLRFDALHAPRRMRRKPREQLLHLADRRLERRHHIGAEFGVVGVPLGIVRNQRQLADEVLDVMEDEGEAAVELLESLRLAERLVAESLGKRARRLVPRRAQQVEVFPVELAAVVGRRKNDDADQALLVKQGNACPRARLVEQPLRHAQRLVLRACPAPAQRGELDNPAARLERGPEIDCVRERVRPWTAPRPFTGTGNGKAAAAVAHQQYSARRIDDVRERADDPLGQRRRFGPGEAQGFGKAQPFRPIIIAVLEQMLGELELDPAARSGARDQDHRAYSHHGQCTDHQRR